MEAGRNLLVDKSPYAKRKNSSVPGFSRNDSSDGDNVSIGTRNQRLLNIQGDGGGAGSLGSHHQPYTSFPPPATAYSSLPSSGHLRPPLLPLPISKSHPLPSPTPVACSKRMVGAGATAAARSADKDQKKPRSFPANPKKDVQPGRTGPRKQPPAATPPVRVLPRSAARTTPPQRHAKSRDKGDASDEVYALSPPPSSLPMPKFSLGSRAPSSSSSPSYNAEAFKGGAPVGGIDAGASDDLRRILRLY